MASLNSQQQKRIEELFPDIVAWVEQVEKEGLEKGEPLSQPFEVTAQALGIRQIDKIRVWKVEAMPSPENPEIEALAEQVGFSIKRSGGMTFRYAILVLRSLAAKNNLLAHELVHVRQYEREGSIDSFLERYIGELKRFDYQNSPLELEATREAARYFPAWE